MSSNLPPAVAAFDERVEDYDSWYEANDELYRAELTAINELLDPVRRQVGGDGLEVGVGTGRFAGPLAIHYGLEPAPRMAARARSRGVAVETGYAENLPFDDERFAYVAFFTALCFVTDPGRALREARRVTCDGGRLLIAFLNRSSPLGRELDARKYEDPYYFAAQFFATDELALLAEDAGYNIEAWRHVLTDEHGQPSVAEGSDDGLYCVLRARRN